MCGIVGTVNLTSTQPVSERCLRQMLAAIRHRGPDQYGLYLEDGVGIGSARLSIIDLASGQQPITNEDDTLSIVFNGEIFNYLELRVELESQGHRFKTSSDTEVILHLFEELGTDCFSRLNGQFAISIWDSRSRTMVLARDRLGIRPLFYTVVNGALVFASEIKAILSDPRVDARLNHGALNQVFTYWNTFSPNTVFEGVFELPAGHFMELGNGKVCPQPYWQLQYPDEKSPIAAKDGIQDYIDEFSDLLGDAIKLRLRADVPVGAYLSGGLDSSLIAAMIKGLADNDLSTFSVTFKDPVYDESSFQRRMAGFLGTQHRVVRADYESIGTVFPSVIWHTETPILRTSPAPLYLLSKLVRENDYKVVLTGEGADEILGGYDIFKESAIRRFWSKDPQSKMRPLLLKRLYPYISDLSSGNGAYLKAFFEKGLTNTSDPFYSHRIRWATTARVRRFFSSDLQDKINQEAIEPSIMPLPPRYSSWNPANQAQYLEITTFLTQYLLSSQGDRMTTAHSVEGRYPFLDHRVVEYCNDLPVNLKLRGLNEKYLLKKVAERWLPKEIWQRTKHPYRAPVHRSFFAPSAPEYVEDLLSESKIGETGLFNPRAVKMLVGKAKSSEKLSEVDDMALAGILSTQLLTHQFIDDFRVPPIVSENDNIKIIRR